MDKIIISPSKYVQGAGTLAKIGDYVKPLGGRPLAIADEVVTGLVGETVTSSFAAAEAKLTMEKFNGECCRDEINRILEIAKSTQADVIVGIGGGKTLDTAKSVAFYSKVPVVVVPTIASTDAPTSALAVIYTPTGEFSEYLMIPTNPNMVIMDTKVIAGAPTRLMVAGMGDALSTYFEARANSISGKPTMAGGASTKAALALAKLCYETLLADGLKAKVAVENNISDKAVENIIEANTLLSGLGFESSGLAAAHAIHNGLTKLEECHHLYHGEKVAFGTLTQLLLENAPMEEIRTVIEFCRSVGLPTNLFDMGVKELDHAKLMEVAEASCAEGETIHNMPFAVTPEMVFAAMLSAHEIGQM
ncbi:glycerol dehydrogenase [Pseudovibrio exalbescens]|uniref:Glycerol dehydrogenase n=3 Tax=Pseudovibrio exalbescens TaxID=197461 RepID=A0A1U7JDH7_9HYPH|nr:glycerol dehydrogenase [Pseudovibrio exalbescens]OKL42744.1 glycerol dehydrogenase [Pseudovibrio exalbescens]